MEERRVKVLTKDTIDNEIFYGLQSKTLCECLAVLTKEQYELLKEILEDES